MTQKKTKQNVAAKKASKKKRSPKPKKEPNSAEVRKNISAMVKTDAEEMAQAVIEEGKKGQLAPVKYLFELCRIFPPSTDGNETTKEEDSLAKTLLNRLDLPDEPIVRDEDDMPVRVAIPEKRAEEETGKRESDQEPPVAEALDTETAGEERKNSVLV